MRSVDVSVKRKRMNHDGYSSSQECLLLWETVSVTLTLEKPQGLEEGMACSRYPANAS